MIMDLSRLQSIKEKRKFWKQHLILWQDSGLSQAEYCRRNNLNKHQWGYWKKRYVKTEATTEFIPLPIEQAFSLSGRSSLTLYVQNQYTIDIDPGFDPCTLKRVLTVLNQL